MLSYEEILEKIKEKCKISKEEIEKMVKEKQNELSGLVSKEGAAYIIGRELGVELIQEGERRLKIKNLVSGLNSVELIARVGKISERRRFEKNGKIGEVINLTVGDETGICRLSLWNDEIKLIDKLKIKEGDAIEIKGGYVRIDNLGNPELRIGRGELKKISDVMDLPKANELKGFSIAKEKNIKDFKEGEFVETKACIVQIFQKNPFFEVCPQCEARIYQKDGKWFCDEHGDVIPSSQIVVSGIIDDGTGCIRAVFFRKFGEKVFGKNVKELKEIAEKYGGFEAIFEHVNALGKDFIFRGWVKKNKFTEKTEFVVNEMVNINVRDEIEYLIKELEESK